MTNPDSRESAPQDLECGFDVLRGDCASMASRWSSPTTAYAENRPERKPGPGAKAGIRAIVVPERSAHLVDGMSQYGD
ncbi:MULTISPECIES: hypothetical protein [Streptomyces]|uniref:Uncharacterized protein n=1 Tax=Streptomyces albus (strain ATCC 21838 / DSM 41398 / FERM P-419 / JCM 4703 / NBRC 107858) TaxID=1081613 RepID=A0A0B5EWD4_STRA4|nr:hypothetical protein [Streptomyces sp. SCSIO ZS0520]AJE86099.1 hypothetical protein SLNWT_5723 [Streptomyces albus]AOU80400.1 hypothetical protein SLNHY_5709 [Streptomyces albus]AYN36112.1 hypothetical protein DUI70_5617 [Streptomyces albus]